MAIHSRRRFALAFVPALFLGCTAGASGANKSSGSAANATSGGAVIARFGDHTLTAGDLNAQLENESPFARARMNTLAKKQQFVEQIVRFDLLADEAKRRGLEKDPEVVRAMQTVMVRKLVQQEIDQNPAKRNLSDAELHAYYNAHIQDFVRPAEVRLSVIVLQAKSKAAAAKRKGEAEALVKKIRAHGDDYSFFGAMVAQKSEDPATQAVQGDLSFLTQKQLAQRYGDAAAQAGFALAQSGDVSDPVVTDKGIYIFKRTGKMAALDQTFAQARSVVAQRDWFEKRGTLFKQLIADLKKKEHYHLDEAALAAFKVNLTAPTRDMPAALASLPHQDEKEGH